MAHLKKVGKNYPLLLVLAVSILLTFLNVPTRAIAASSVIQSTISNGTPVITSPPGSTGSGSTLITGTTAPNSPVTIANNGRVAAKTTATPAGNFSTTIPLSTGDNQIIASTPSEGNNQPKTSKPFTITRKQPRSLLRQILQIAAILAGIAITVVIMLTIVMRHRRKQEQQIS